jgi:site-specific recombinase XerC
MHDPLSGRTSQEDSHTIRSENVRVQRERGSVGLRPMKIARARCPSLEDKRISPHVLRHATAVQLLRSGVDHSVIVLWLGHESLQSTQVSLDADLAFKEKVLNEAPFLNTRVGRFRADDRLIAFLKNL